jgi:hypothetical protein
VTFNHSRSSLFVFSKIVPGDMGKAVVRTLDRLTLIALPFEGHRGDRKDLGIAAAGQWSPFADIAIC